MGDEDVHVTVFVTSNVVPSAYVAMAERRDVPPAMSTTSEGWITSDFKAAGMTDTVLAATRFPE
jgi:hypothetical protein